MYSLQWNMRAVIPAVGKAAAVAAASVLIPFLMHFIPQAGAVPWGARLLPMFYAPLCAFVLLSPRYAYVSALLAPVANHLVTGMPVRAMVAGLTIELLFFSMLFSLLYKKFPRVAVTAPAAYLAAHTLCMLLSAAFPAIRGVYSANTGSITSLYYALPGVCILGVLHYFAVKIKHSS